MSAAVTRRAFLGRTSALAFGALYPGILRVATALPLSAQGPRKRVLVLGAGLAGLSAAFELAAAGHEVSVLEPRTRAGGRVYTLREPFSDGLYADVGATRISDTNDWVLKYTERFNLPLDPFRPANGADVYHLRGKRFVAGDNSPVDWPLSLTTAERRLGLSGMRAKYLQAAFDEIGDAGAPGVPPERLRRFDEVSYHDFILRQGASSDAAELLLLGAGSNEQQDTSALMRLRAQVWRTRTKRWSKIRGGNDRLPKAFAAALRDRIHYGAEVVRIEQLATHVRVTTMRGGVAYPFEGEYVVCTIPFSVLRRLEVRPDFSAPVQRAIRELNVAPATKAFVQTRSRFWEAQQLSGFGVTDRPIQEVWNLSTAQAGVRGLLVAYMTGPNAERAARMPAAEGVAWTAAEIDRLLPGTIRELEGGATHAWADDPWSRGAYCNFAPGQLIPMLALLRRPEGRVYFAGDYASAWPGWMQGALESGNYVARAIDAAS